MTGEEIAVWLSNIYGELSFADVEGRRVAFATLDDDYRVATSVGFSNVDTGLVMQAEDGVDVRCELAIGSSQASDAELAAAIVGVWDYLERNTIAVQPGVFVPFLVQQTPLGGVDGVTVQHASFREPTWFEQCTPHLQEPGRITLLLELVLLTEEEHTVALERGIDGLATRLRRRGTALGDLRRE